jgi:hypothetical protein
MSQQHEDDIALLKEAIECAKIDHKESFENMLEKLEGHPTWTLTSKQRTWASEVVGKPVYENLVSNKQVPRGREVPTPAVLLNRPLRPPGRK